MRSDGALVDVYATVALRRMAGRTPEHASADRLAVYQDPRHAAVFADPQGGLADLSAGVIRTVGDPDARFGEDGLRPLRGARFAAVLEFSVDPATLAAMGRARAGLARVARERVRDELVKLLAAPRPSVGIEILRETGLLEDILPELLEGVGMEQNRFHAHTVYEHTLRTLDAATYMPGAVLPKVDRMSMQVSLEVRCPLLDREVAALAQGLPLSACWQAPAMTKRILKDLAGHYLPTEWMNRRKMGFGLPSSAWSNEVPVCSAVSIA